MKLPIYPHPEAHIYVENVNISGNLTPSFPCQVRLQNPLYKYVQLLNSLFMAEEFQSRPEEEDDDGLAESVREITGYEFRNPRLLRQAFTDHSYLDEDKDSKASSQRMEYVGDAVLGFFMATVHYAAYPDLPAGQLTKLRAANVDTEKLARAALKHRLYRFLRHKKPLLEQQIKQFEEEILSHPIHSFGLIDVPKSLADIVESLVGAVHLDCNSVVVTSKIINNLLQPMVTPVTLRMHPVTKLYEICQKHKAVVKCNSKHWHETGVVEYFVDDELVGSATYKAKKLVAQSRAAHNAYQRILQNWKLDKYCGQ